jgi:hypothetical protein
MFERKADRTEEEPTLEHGALARVRNRLRLPRQSDRTSEDSISALDTPIGEVVAFGRLRSSRPIQAKVVRTEMLKPLVVEDDFAD